MKRIISLLLALTLLVGCMTVLSSCGNPNDEGAQFSIYVGESVYDFDPTDYYVDTNSEKVMSLLFEPLFTLDEDGDLEYGMAKDYDIDKSERTITIKLRESEWSNGMKVQADDFVSAWRDIIISPDTANPAAALFYDVEGALDVSLRKEGVNIYTDLGLSTDGPSKIIIKYREGADTKQLLKNLASVATSPICKSVLSKPSVRDTWTKFLDTLVCNGPFKVKRIDYDEGTFTLERNKGYHQYTEELVEIEDYIGQVTPFLMFANFSGNVKDTEKEVKALTYKDIEENTVFFMSEATLADRKANKDEAVVADAFSTYSFAFDTSDINSIVSNAKVRQALSLVIDRNAIIEAVTFGKAAVGLIPEVVDEDLRKKNDVISVSANKAQAQALLSQVDLNAYTDKVIDVLVNNDEESVKIASIVEAAWESLGIEVNVIVKGATCTYREVEDSDPVVDYRDSAVQQAVKYASLKGDMRYYDDTNGMNGTWVNVDAIAFDWQLYTNDAFVGLASMSSVYNGSGSAYATDEHGNIIAGVSAVQRTNITGWKNSEYDKYIDDAYKATDDDTRLELLKKAEKLLVEEAPIIPVMFNQNFAFVSRDLKKVDVDGHGNFVLTKAKLRVWDSENQVIEKD